MGLKLLITGGTGSFARNFIKYVLKTDEFETIRVYSRDEHKQTELLGEYGGIKGGSDNRVRGFIGDIRDLDRLRMAMQGIDVVVHAAALKQVQSCEYNPLETIKTNIMGSANVIQAALDNNVDRVLAISTDKAVSPLNLYGSTKMCMEKLFINANSYRGKNRRTKFCCTRYGNVADSRGTVVHIWREQIRKSIPLKVTNDTATRFWITMSQANRFVLDTITDMNDFSGGEIFVPFMDSVRLPELREAMAGKDYPFEIIGERIGDKIHEALVLKEELRHSVAYHNKIVVIPEDPSWHYVLPDVKPLILDKTHDYTSLSNGRFLSADEIRETLAKS